VERHPATDLERVIARHRPAILEGLLEDQPQLTLHELGERWGEHVVPVATTVDGVATYTPDGGIAFREMVLRDYLAHLDDPDPGMVSARPEDYLPGIAARLPALEPGPSAAWRRSRLWVSPPGAITPLHHEVTSNLLAQLEGDKKVTLYSPWAHRAMYPERPWSRMPHMSRVAAHAPDLSAQPRFADARPWVASLHADDVLYIPPLWWHWVLTESRSLSHNLWFAGPAIALLAGGLERYKALRSLRL